MGLVTTLALNIASSKLPLLPCCYHDSHSKSDGQLGIGRGEREEERKEERRKEEKGQKKEEERRDGQREGKGERFSHKIGHDLALYRALFVAHIYDSNLALYPGSSTEKRGGSLEDLITCPVT